MSDMIDVQQAFVADHIAELARERAAIRAEAALGHGPAVAGGRLDEQPGRRIRLGRWLMTLGERVAGPRPLTEEPARLRSARAASDPCGEGPDRLAPAA
jgi:hypothetical protein